MHQASISYFTVAAEVLDTSNKNLLLYIGEQRICYAIMENELIVAFEKYTIDTGDSISIDSFFSSKKWLIKPYQTVSIAYGSIAMTLIPSKLHQYETITNTLDYLFGSNSNQKALATFCERHQVYTYYRVHISLLRKMLSLYPKANSSHYAHYFLSQFNRFDGYTLVLHCTDDSYMITAFDGTQLLLCKNYEVTTNENLCYQLLAICQMHHKANTDITLLVGGWVATTSPLYQSLQQYFEKVIIDNAHNIQLNNDGYEKHFFTPYEVIHQINT